MKIKCLVACTNSNGEPELLRVVAKCTQAEYDNGDHYEKAKDAAEAEGYESPVWVADENDPGYIHPTQHEGGVFVSEPNVERIRGDADAGKQTGRLSPSDDATCSMTELPTDSDS